MSRADFSFVAQTTFARFWIALTVHHGSKFNPGLAVPLLLLRIELAHSMAMDGNIKGHCLLLTVLVKMAPSATTLLRLCDGVTPLQTGSYCPRVLKILCFVRSNQKMLYCLCAGY